MSFELVPPIDWQIQLNKTINERLNKLRPRVKKTNLQDRKVKFQNKIAEFKDRYPREMLVEFYEYWTEISDRGRKMRFEKQTVFQVSRRLATWEKNQRKNYESFAAQDDRRLLESFENTASLRLQKIPFQGGHTKALDSPKQTDWGNTIIS